MPWAPPEDAELVDSAEGSAAGSWSPPVDAERWTPPADAEVVKPEVSAVDEEKAQMLSFAKKRLDEAWFPNLKATAVGLGASVVSPVARFFGASDHADFVNRFSDAYQQAAAERDKTGLLPAAVMRGLRGAGETLPTMTVASLGGPWGVIGTMAAQAADKAVTRGKDAGLKGAELNKYVLRQGLVEGVPYAIMQKFGAGGLVSVLGEKGSTLAAKGVLEGLKSVGISTAEQLPPALVASVGSAVNAKLSGVDPKALDYDRLADDIKETTAQTLIQGGVISATHALGAKLLPPDGNISRSVAEEHGVPDEVITKGQAARNAFRDEQQKASQQATQQAQQQPPAGQAPTAQEPAAQPLEATSVASEQQTGATAPQPAGVPSDAQQVEKAGPDDGSRGPQQVVRPQDGNPPDGGQGVQPSGRGDGDTEGQAGQQEGGGPQAVPPPAPGAAVKKPPLRERLGKIIKEAPKATPEENVDRYAKENDLPAQTFASVVSDVHAGMKEQNAAERAAKADAHRQTGITGLMRHNIENTGKDFTYRGDDATGKLLKDFDVKAERVVEANPEAFSSEARKDPSRAVWDLLNREPIPEVRLDDPKVLKEAHAAVAGSYGQSQRSMFHGMEDLPGQQDLFDDIDADRSQRFMGLPAPGVMADLNDAAAGIGNIAKSLHAALSPATVSTEARSMAGNIREKGAELAMRDDQINDALGKFGKALMKLPQQGRYDFIDGVETGAKQPTSELQRAADTMRIALDIGKKRIQDLGKGDLDNFIENYFPHIWEDPNAAAKIFGKKPLEGPKSFLKKRTIPTTKEGLAAGLKPVTENPAELVMLKLHEMGRYEMAQKILAEGKDQGYIKLARTPGSQPDGWVKINDKIATVWERRPTTKADGSPGAPEFVHRGDYYAHPDAARVINNHLSPGLRNSETWGTIYNSLRYTGNLLNMAQLGLSAFHLTTTAGNSVISRLALAAKELADARPLAAAKTALSAPIAPISNYLKGRSLLKEAIRPGSVGGDMAAIADAGMAGGFRLRREAFNRLGPKSTSAWDSFVKALKEGRPSAVPKALAAALEKSSWLLMEHIVPTMKRGAFADMAQYELSKMDPKISRQDFRDVMGKAWDSVDNRMGELVYDNLFWNKTLKDSLMLGTRSLGWNLGTMRELGLGAKDLFHGDFSHRAAYTIALPLTHAVLGAIATYLYTGHGPQQLWDYMYPPTGQKDELGQDRRIQFPDYMKDVMGFATSPIRTIQNKANPLASAMWQMMQNRDYYGDQIRNENDPAMQQMKQIGEYIAKQFIPFSGRNIAQQSKKGESPATQAAAFFGVPQAPQSAIDSPSVGYLKSLSSHTPKTPEETETGSKGDIRKQLRDALSKGESIAGIDWKGKVGPAELREIRKKSMATRMANLYADKPMTQALHAAEMTTDEEWKIVRPILVKKMQAEQKRAEAGYIAPVEWKQILKDYKELLNSRKPAGSL
jgi:hypothetical protein